MVRPHFDNRVEQPTTESPYAGRTNVCWAGAVVLMITAFARSGGPNF